MDPRRVAALFGVCLLTACGSTQTKTIPSSGYLLPNATVEIGPTIAYSVEQIAVAGAAAAAAALPVAAPVAEITDEQLIAYAAKQGYMTADHILLLTRDMSTYQELDDETKAEKKAIEDARFVLPNACETKMVVTMNARSLQNFFHLRCCNRAQWEIRQLAEEMLRLVCPVAPHIFRTAGPACVSGPCPEGKMCCGRTAEVRARYAALKGEKAE